MKFTFFFSLPQSSRDASSIVASIEMLKPFPRDCTCCTLLDRSQCAGRRSMQRWISFCHVLLGPSIFLMNQRQISTFIPISY